MKRALIMLGVLGSIVGVTAACDDMLVAVEPLEGGGGAGTAVTSSMSATSLATTVVTQNTTTADMTTDIATTTGTTGGCGDQVPVGALENCSSTGMSSGSGVVSCGSCVKDDTMLEWVSVCTTGEGCECLYNGVVMCQCALADPCGEPTCCPAPWGAFGAN